MRQRTIHDQLDSVLESTSDFHSTQSKQLHWLQLIRDRRWSIRQKIQLIKEFGCPTQVYQQPNSLLRQFTSGRWQSTDLIVDKDSICLDLEWLENPHHQLVCLGDQNYPELLVTLPDPPLALFTSGDTRLLSDPSVAIVGSRHPTPAGRRITEQIASELARSGINIVSGMALGIDGSAHQAALDAGGSTVAVMGCGLDDVYPSRHRSLFERISSDGCCISEYPLGVPVSRYTFPQRNRLVSGLCLGTIIVEAAERSGTLITARLALEQNRSLMVVPGSPLSRQYAGSHDLLQQGATLVTNAEDVLNELQIPLQQALTSHLKKDADEGQKPAAFALLEHIFHESTSVDAIISTSGLTAAKVSSILLELEVAGAVTQASDGGYIKLLDERSS